MWVTVQFYFIQKLLVKISHNSYFVKKKFIQPMHPYTIQNPYALAESCNTPDNLLCFWSWLDIKLI